MSGIIAETMKRAVDVALEPPKPNNKWMLFVLIGFVAGSIFGSLLSFSNQVNEQTKATCDTCQKNLDIMVGNFNVMAKQCHVANEYPFPSSYVNKSNNPNPFGKVV